jgi:hypothetical protein
MAHCFGFGFAVATEATPSEPSLGYEGLQNWSSGMPKPNDQTVLLPSRLLLDQLCKALGQRVRSEY